MPGMSRLRLPLAIAALTVAARGSAGEPAVQFDIARVVECRDVTTPDFAQSHPDERIVEAKFRLSLFSSDSKESDLDELLVSLRSPERRLRVVDFSPKSELASDLAEPVTIVETTEKNRSLDAAINGTLSAEYGIVRGQALPTAGAHASNRSTVQETYKKLPPQFPVIISGTTDGRHGAFFKFRRWTMRSLEGETEVVCQFAVPQGWRGDWITLSCQARAPDKWYTSKESEELGGTTVLVGLHLQGDTEAFQAATAIAELQKPRRARAAANKRTAQRQGGFAEFRLWSKKMLAAVPSSARRAETAPPKDSLAEACQALAELSGTTGGANVR